MFDDQKRGITTLVCSSAQSDEITETRAALSGIAEVVTFKPSKTGIRFSGLQEGTHVTGPVVLLTDTAPSEELLEALRAQMAPFVPLTTLSKDSVSGSLHDAILGHVMETLDDFARASATRNMDLRRQIARLRVEMETTSELVQALKLQNAALATDALNSEVLRWAPGLSVVRPGDKGVIEQRLPRELRGTPLGAVCVLAANSHQEEQTCLFQIIDDDTETVVSERKIAVPPGQSWVLCAVKESELTMFEFRRLRIKPLKEAGAFLSFRQTDTVEPVEQLRVNGSQAPKPLALRIYSGAFDADLGPCLTVDGNDNVFATPMPQNIVNGLQPVSEITKPEKWFTASKGRVLVHPSKEDVSLVGGRFQNADHGVVGMSLTATLADPKAHPTHFRYLVLPEADDDAVLTFLRGSDETEAELSITADSGWTTVLPTTQALLPALTFGEAVRTGHLYLATRPAAGETAYCRANFINFVWHLVNAEAQDLAATAP